MSALVLTVPLTGPAGGSPLVQVSIDLASTSASATVTHEDGDYVSIEGHVMVDQPQSIFQTTTMSASSPLGWEVSVVPEQFSSNNPCTTLIHVSVGVPRGVEDGTTETVTVRASTKASILSPTVATENIEITVKNTSPKPEWTVRISDPKANHVFTTDELTINGTASYNLGDIDSVEVKVCTGPWNVATGTTEWTIDYDCKNLADGEHTIYVRARSGEEVSPKTELKVTQDRPDKGGGGGNGGGSGSLSSGAGDESSWLFTYALPIVLIIAVAVGIYLLYRRRGSEEREYLATHY
jgi:hypothetical protein